MEKHGFVLTPDAEDLLSKLLEKDKNKRLGKNGEKEVLDHKWFKSIDTN